MKILILNSAGKFIGEAAHCLDLTEQLLSLGHDASLVLREGSLMHQRAMERKLPVAAVLKFSGNARVLSTLNDFLTLRRLIARFRPDVLHCHRGTDHGLGVACITTLTPARQPALMRTRHRVMPVRNTISNRWLFISATQGVIAVSKKAADSFGPMGSLIREKLSIIYSSVDTKGFNPLRRCVNWRKQHGVGEDEPLIGLIARLQRVKGQQQFLQAAAIILKEFPRARFLVAGIGQPHKRARLEQYADQLGIRDHIIFQDWLPDVHTVTASLDVGVLASLGSEGSSRVTYEYMASGVAVVATSVGCIPEVIEHGHTGLVVPPGNPEAMAEAIIETLRSPEARKEMQIRALARIELNHNRAKWVNATVDCYTRAVNLKAHKKWNWSGFVATAQGILTGKSVSEDDAYPSPPLNEAKG